MGVSVTEAERAVLSACILSPDAIRFARPIIDPEDFYDPRLEHIYRILLDLDHHDTPIDAIAVATEATRRKIPGVGYPEIAKLLDGTANAGSVTHHAGIVREESARRQITAMLVRAQQSVADPSVEASTVVQGLAEDLERIRDGNTTPTRAKTLGEIMAITDTYEWVIPGLLEKRDRVIITAAEGSGKSTMIRQLAIAPATGIHPFTLQPIEPLRVLVIDSENSERQWRRACARIIPVAQQAGGHGDPLTNVQVACVPRMAITRDKELGKIHRMIEAHRPHIVGIGPLYRLAPGSMNSDDDAAPVLAALDTIRDTGAAMVIEAHAGKGANTSGTRDLRPRGSSALLGWPEFGFGIAPAVSEPGVYEVQRWRGDREERDWPERLRRGRQWPWEDAMTAGLTRWNTAS